jgi:hypothetical protein
MKIMKLVLTTLGLVAVLALFGWNGMSMPSMESFGPISLDNWTEQLADAFDPAWYENFQKADLPTMLKALSGSAQK